MIAGQIHQQANTGLNIADYQEIKIRLSRFETKGATTLKTFGVKRLRNTKSLESLWQQIYSVSLLHNPLKQQ